MTDQPAVGPLGAEDVKLLVKGDLLRHAVAPNVFRLLRKTSGEWPDLWLHMVGEPHTAHMADRWLFEARADPDGWIPWSGGENPVPGQGVEVKERSGRGGVVFSDDVVWSNPSGVRPNRDIIAFRLTNTGGEVEASGEDFEPDPEVIEDAVAKILAPYLPMINSTPDLLSILYDADLMPEQTVTVRGAICVAAVCEAHKAALRTTPVPSVDLAELKRLVQEIADGMPRVRAVHRFTHARANALQALALIAQIKRGEG